MNAALKFLGPKAIPSVLGILLATITLTAAWPTLGSAWHSATPWATVLVSNPARISWIMLAIVAGILSWKSGHRWAVTLMLPIGLAAIFPPDRLDLSSDLLDRRLSLEAEATAIALEQDREAPSQSFLAQQLPAPGLEAFLERRPVFDLTRANEETRSPDDPALQNQLNVHRIGLGVQRSIIERVDQGEACQDEEEAYRAQVAPRNLAELNRAVPGLRVLRLRELESCREDAAQARENAIRAVASVEQSIAEVEAEIARIAQLHELRITAAASERRTQAAVVAATLQTERAARTLAIASTAAVAAVAAMLFLPSGMTVLWVMIASLSIILGIHWILNLPSATPAPLDWLRIGAAFVATTMVLLAARMVRMYAVQNAYLFHLIRPGEWAALLMRFARDASVPVILLGLGIFASAWLDRQILNPAYSGPAGTRECEEVGRILSTDLAAGGCANRQLELDIENAVVRHFEDVRADLRVATADASAEAVAGADWAQEEAGRLFNAAVPHFLSEGEDRADQGHISPAFNTRRCGWNLLCYGVNWGKRQAQGAYIDTRGEAQIILEDELQEAAASVEQGSGVGKEQIDIATDLALAQMQANLDRALWTMFRTGDVVAHIAALLLIVALLKSLGYVYLRNVYSLPDFNNRVDELARNAGFLRQPVEDANQPGSLTIEPTEDMAVAASVQVPDHRSASACFAPTISMVLRRLVPAIINPDWANATFRVYKNISGHHFRLSTNLNTTLTAIHLNSQERVAFKPSALAAYSRNLTIRSKWSFGVLDLLALRLRGPVAIGPGTIVLRTKGGVNVADVSNDRLVPVSSAGLVAWTPDTPCTMEGSASFLQTLTGTTGVRPIAGGVALSDGGVPEPSGIGLSRTLLLMLPL